VEEHEGELDEIAAILEEGIVHGRKASVEGERSSKAGLGADLRVLLIEAPPFAAAREEPLVSSAIARLKTLPGPTSRRAWGARLETCVFPPSSPAASSQALSPLGERRPLSPTIYDGINEDCVRGGVEGRMGELRGAELSCKVREAQVDVVHVRIPATSRAIYDANHLHAVSLICRQIACEALQSGGDLILAWRTEQTRLDWPALRALLAASSSHAGCLVPSGGYDAPAWNSKGDEEAAQGVSGLVTGRACTSVSAADQVATSSINQGVLPRLEDPQTNTPASQEEGAHGLHSPDADTPASQPERVSRGDSAEGVLLGCADKHWTGDSEGEMGIKDAACAYERGATTTLSADLALRLGPSSDSQASCTEADEIRQIKGHLAGATPQRSSVAEEFNEPISKAPPAVSAEAGAKAGVSQAELDVGAREASAESMAAHEGCSEQLAEDLERRRIIAALRSSAEIEVPTAVNPQQGPRRQRRHRYRR